MRRRNFLRAMGALSIPAISGLNSIRANTSSLFTSLINPDSDRVLVVVHLFGGNDGLNTLIPLDQYSNLLELRRSLMIPQQELLSITDSLAFHPAMSGARDLFDQGQLGIIQNVGYANQNRSHFRSTDIWNTGSSATDIIQSGWLGRYFEGDYPGYPQGFPNEQLPHPPAISMGQAAHPSCQGVNINFSHAVDKPNSVTVLAAGGDTPLPNDNYGDETRFLRTLIEQTNTYGNLIKNASLNGRNTVEYPSSNSLASQLRDIARLISGGLKTKVYTVYANGFDTHADQVTTNPIQGKHTGLLQQVSESISAFQQDLVQQDLHERVLGMTFSEFGRRIRSNNSRGTDHGDAGPMFFFGSCLEQTILGDNPSINRGISQSEGVAMQFDFRDVYGSVLTDWFQVEENRVRDVLYEDFQYLPILTGCEASLPVSLLDFLATAAEKSIELTWRTTTETDNAGFYVERSTDGSTFSRMGWVPASPPSASGQRAYGFTDRSVVPGVRYYYRLRQEDHGGTFTYSQVRTAILLGGIERWNISQLSPNPAEVKTAFTCTATEFGMVQYSVHDAAGRMVLTESEAINPGVDHQVELRVSRLTSGIYTVKITTPDGGLHPRKLVIR